ncbi:MAG TPA: MFS transporter [Gammaproteobacteria bacterium]|nr:MFS transporter [Gammaproteobacteria bacterium]
MMSLRSSPGDSKRTGSVTASTAIAAEDAVYRKVTARLIPFLFCCYVMAHVDRNNIGYAVLQMKSDLGFTDATYGLAAGIFFVGYVLFEIPSNLMLMRVGARRTLSAIMLAWGLVSITTLFTQTPAQFLIMRFLLGVFEAGFFPGVVLFLTWWYPSRRRAQIVAIFMTAIVVAGVVAGPSSGLLLTSMDGMLGLRGWRWMFLLEGFPSIALAGLGLHFLRDSPRDAEWLSPGERWQITADLHAEPRPDDESTHAGALLELVRSPSVYILSLIFFLNLYAVYTLSFWQPTLIGTLGAPGPLAVGLLAVIPYSVAIAAMLWVGRSSDRLGERRWHFLVPMIIGSLGVIFTVIWRLHPVLAITALTFGTAGIFSSIPVFWAVPAELLPADAAAVGFALINSVGACAGAVAPYVMGLIKTSTGSMAFGLYAVSGCLLLGAILMVISVPRSHAHP